MATREQMVELLRSMPAEERENFLQAAQEVRSDAAVQAPLSPEAAQGLKEGLADAREGRVGPAGAPFAPSPSVVPPSGTTTVEGPEQKAERLRGELVAPVVSESNVTYPSARNPPVVGANHEQEAERLRAERTANAPVVSHSGKATAFVAAPAGSEKTKTYPFEPVAVEPGDVGQLFLQAPGDGVIQGVHVVGGELTMFIHRQTRLDMAGNADLPATPVTMGDTIMFLAKNTSEEARLIGGEIAITGTNLPEPPKQRLEESQAAFALAATPRQETPPEVIEAAVKASGRIIPGSAGRAVIPGDNEVAVLMTRNDARLMVELLRNGVRPLDVHCWGLIRRFDDAMKT